MSEDGVGIDLAQATPPAMTVVDVIGLLQLFNNQVQLFNSQLLAMEGRLGTKMDDNSKAAAERWALHDRELAANTQRVVQRFENLEKDLAATASAVAEHHRQAHEEEIANEARVKPIKMSVAWMWAQRKDILLLVIFLMAAWAAVAETFGRIIGPHAP